MMNSPLLITSFIDRAADFFGNVEIVSRLADRSIHRYTYKDCRARVRNLAAVLQSLGLKPGERVGTLMCNHYAHIEAYFGIPLAGGVLHTLNARLHPPDIARIAAHAADRFVIVDDSVLPIWEEVSKYFTPERVIVVRITGGAAAPRYDDYESLLRAERRSFTPIPVNENDAVGLCYTSGTTGFPKGILSSHRSLALHSMVLALPDILGLRQSDVILPVVPMFHVNGWGLPFAAAMVGAKLVLPGPCLDPPSILQLLESEHATFSAGVPTIWLGMLKEMEAHPGIWNPPPGMRMLVGGSAVPQSLIRAYEKHGIRLIQGWGLTETSPLATISGLKSYMSDFSEEERTATLAKQGIPAPFIELRAVNADGVCPQDGQTMGELQVRGPWVAAGYFKSDAKDSVEGLAQSNWTNDGWFRTGDVGTVDGEGFMRITDRTKDLIKSGGEWISSVDLENALMSHPLVQEAAVIAIPDEKWSERPLAVVVLKDNVSVTSEMLRAHLAPRFAKWSLPDKFSFVKEIPRTSTGKFLKTKLRELYRNGDLPT